MVGIASAAESWAALTLLVLFGVYAWRRYAQRGSDEPAWSEGEAGVLLLLTVLYAAATVWTGLPWALFAATTHLPIGVSALAAGLPVLVGLFCCYWVPEYVAQAHAVHPEALASTNALRAARGATRGVLLRFGWIAIGAAGVVQFGALLGAPLAAAAYLLLREAYEYHVTLQTTGTARPATAREVERVRELFGDAAASRAPVRVFEPDDPEEWDAGEMPALLTGAPGRRRFLVHEGLLDRDPEPVRASQALTRHQLDVRAFDVLLLARAARLAVLFGAVGLFLPIAAPTPPLPVGLLAVVVAAPAVAAALERIAWDRLFEADRRAAAEVGREAFAALLADYDGPPADRTQEFLMLHPSAQRRIAELGVEPEAVAGGRSEEATAAPDDDADPDGAPDAAA